MDFASVGGASAILAGMAGAMAFMFPGSMDGLPTSTAMVALGLGVGAHLVNVFLIFMAVFLVAGLVLSRNRR